MNFLYLESLHKIFKGKEMSERMYHIIFINENKMEKSYQTRFPMTHDQCMTMISKMSPKKHGRYQVEESKNMDVSPVGSFPCPEYVVVT